MFRIMESKVRFADHPGVTVDSVKIKSYRFSLPIRSAPLDSNVL
jgi:hypothetical protein